MYLDTDIDQSITVIPMTVITSIPGVNFFKTTSFESYIFSYYSFPAVYIIEFLFNGVKKSSVKENFYFLQIIKILNIQEKTHYYNFEKFSTICV